VAGETHIRPIAAHSHLQPRGPLGRPVRPPVGCEPCPVSPI
jgi:hypothetical protein